VIGVAVFALVQRSHAQTDANRAKARELAASALVQLPVDGQAAVALALQAARLNPSEQSEDVLRKALTESHERALVDLGAPLVSTSFDRTGTRVLAASMNGSVRLLDAGGRTLWEKRAAKPLVGAFFMPDGRSVVVAGGSGVWIWDVGTGRQLRRLTLPAPVSSVGVAPLQGSPAGLLLVGQPGKIELVPLVPGRRQRALATAGMPIALQASGRLLAAIVRDAKGTERATVFELRRRQLLETLPGKGVKAIAFSPRGRLLATGSSDRSARLWNPRKGRLLQVLPHKGWVVSLAFSPDGREFATTSKDGGTRVWDVRTGVRLLIFFGPIGSINSVDYSSSGRFLLAGSSDRTARVDDTGGAEEGRELTVLTGNRDAVTTASFSPNEQLAVTGGSDGTVRIWEPGVADQLRVIDAERRPVRRVAFSPDGRRLLIVRDSALHVRLAATNALTESLDTRRKLVDASFSPGGRFLAAESADGLVQVLRGGSVVLRLQAGGTGMTFAGDGRLLTAGARRADLWALPGGQHLRSLQVGSQVLAVAATRDGRTGATLALGGRVELWNLDTGERLGRLSRPANRIVFSPDGRLLLTTWAKDAFLWQVDGLKLLHVLSGHTADLTAADFSPGGGLVLAGSFDHDARVWSVADGRLISVLRGHFFPIYSVDASLDERWALTAGQLTVGVWRASSGQLLFFLRGPQETISDVAFGADGRSILVGSEDGAAYLYRCDVCGNLDALERLAEQRLRSAPRPE
jgi:WD40 repeat protein